MSQQNGAPARYLTMDKAACHLAQETGVKVSSVTVWRWCTQGIGGIRLQHCRLGRRFLTNETWLKEFMAALAAKSFPPTADGSRGYQPPGPLPSVLRTPRGRSAIRLPSREEVKAAGLS